MTTPRETDDHIGEANEKVTMKPDDILAILRADRLPECSFDNGMTWVTDDVIVAETFSRTADVLEKLLSEIAALRGERDTAQSAVEAWAHVCESLEAHLQDRVAMQDVANPERYLNILRSNMARVQKDSEQIRAARWADYRRGTDRATQAERQRDELRKALEPFARLELPPHKSIGNAGFYSILHSDIRHADQALANQGAE